MIRVEPSPSPPSRPVLRESIDLALIRVDGGTQSRAVLQESVVEEYASALIEGASFPPVVVFYDGSTHWLADGFHRFRAHEKLGLADIPADVRQGTRRDAILFSVGANETHGLRRTNEDKRRAVLTLLNDEEWARWPQTKIAQACAVSQGYVSKVAAEIGGAASYNGNKMREVERNGSSYTMNTAAIGKAAQSQTEEQMEDVEAPERSPEARPRNRFALADGLTFEDVAQQGMALEATGITNKEAARRFGIGNEAYRCACDVVALRDRGGFSAADAELVERAFTLLVEGQQPGQARDLVDPVAVKVWGDGSYHGRPRGDREPARLERFQHAFGIIMQGCANGAEMDLPYLSEEEAKKSIKQINEAVRNLRHLKERIERLHQ
jgi:hypothetical protein